MRDFILTIAALGCFLFASCGDYNKLQSSILHKDTIIVLRRPYNKLFLYSKALKPVRSLFSFWVWRI